MTSGHEYGSGTLAVHVAAIVHLHTHACVASLAAVHKLLEGARHVFLGLSVVGVLLLRLSAAAPLEYVRKSLSSMLGVFTFRDVFSGVQVAGVRLHQQFAQEESLLPELLLDALAAFLLLSTQHLLHELPFKALPLERLPLEILLAAALFSEALALLLFTLSLEALLLNTLLLSLF